MRCGSYLGRIVRLLGFGEDVGKALKARKDSLWQTESNLDARDVIFLRTTIERWTQGAFDLDSLLTSGVSNEAFGRVEDYILNNVALRPRNHGKAIASP